MRDTDLFIGSVGKPLLSALGCICRVDGEGMICEQSGVYRVNCIDCLDRTNVVQTAVARIIIDQQVSSLLPYEQQSNILFLLSFNFP